MTEGPRGTTRQRQSIPLPPPQGAESRQDPRRPGTPPLFPMPLLFLAEPEVRETAALTALHKPGHRRATPHATKPLPSTSQTSEPACERKTPSAGSSKGRQGRWPCPSSPRTGTAVVLSPLSTHHTTTGYYIMLLIQT